MLEVTLAEYTSHLFQEVVRARQLSDLHSKAVAEAYANDEVLQHFPVPRFRIPKVTMSIPVVVERATFKELGAIDVNEISASVGEHLAVMVRTIQGRRPGFRLRPFGPDDRPGVAAFVARVASEHETVDVVAASREFARSFLRPAVVAGPEHFVSTEPDIHAASETGLSIANLLRNAFRVNRAGIEALFVNPVTSAVKEGGGATSVFTLTAELIEEGFFLRTIRDDETGARRTIVEFD
jgi:hypothetical protein